MVANGQLALLLAAGHVPEADNLVAATRGQDLTVRREGDRYHGIAVPREREHFLACGHVPDVQAVGLPCRQQTFAVGRESQATNPPARVTMSQFRSAGGIPELNSVRMRKGDAG